MWRRVPRARDAHRQGRRTPPHVTPSPLPASLLDRLSRRCWDDAPSAFSVPVDRFGIQDDDPGIVRTLAPGRIHAVLLSRIVRPEGDPPPVPAGQHRIAPRVTDPDPPPTPGTGRRVTPGIHVRVGTPIPIRNAGDDTRPAARSASRSMTGPMPAPGGSRTSNTTGSSNPGRSPGSVRSRIRNHDCRLPLGTRHGIAAWSTQSAARRINSQSPGRPARCSRPPRA